MESPSKLIYLSSGLKKAAFDPKPVLNVILPKRETDIEDPNYVTADSRLPDKSSSDFYSAKNISELRDTSNSFYTPKNMSELNTSGNIRRKPGSQNVPVDVTVFTSQMLEDAD